MDALLQTDKENLSIVVTHQKEVDFLQKIGAYGVENTKGKCKEYLDIGIKIDELEKSLKYFESNLKSAIEEISEVELSINKYKSTQLSEEGYEQALNKAKELDEKNKSSFMTLKTDIEKYLCRCRYVRKKFRNRQKLSPVPHAV